MNFVVMCCLKALSQKKNRFQYVDKKLHVISNDCYFRILNADTVNANPRYFELFFFSLQSPIRVLLRVW